LKIIGALKSVWLRALAKNPATTSDYYPTTSDNASFPNVTRALARNAGKLNSSAPVYVHARNHADNQPWENYND
jgi:hypothetical protein